PQTPRDRNATGPLRVLFVGSLDLRKGVPYLLRAVEDCGGQTQLTLAGADGGTLEEFFNRSTANVKRAGRKNKSELRELYWQSDVLVLPSLVDSFGFVALEAMACGLPVIVTANCGAPVPSPDWRVPVMNSNAIASRLEHYAGDRDALSRDGLTASSFARHFTPERYRAGIREVLAELL
ncbi:MAG TPA: glycosyltransferase family 4 protein, partial [Verrucomicrobiota bacterium]|nr:glycosyltransferase family 4 protein [Verrucomicrobiota bacterium]